MAASTDTTNADGNVDFRTFDQALQDLGAAADTMTFVEEILSDASSVDLSQQGQSGLYHLIRVWRVAARNAHDTSYRHLHLLGSEQTVSADMVNQARAQAYADGQRDMLEMVKVIAPDLADVTTRKAGMCSRVAADDRERHGLNPVPILTEPVEATESLTSAAQG